MSLARDDDFDEDAGGEVACPFCEAADDSCGHLLAYIDRTFGQIEGGTFFDHESRAVEILDQAIAPCLQTLTAKSPRQRRQLLNRITPRRLATLVEEAEKEEDLRVAYGAFLDYLDDLLLGLPNVVEAEHDVEGGPGQSSLCKSYWAENGEQAAHDALTQIAKEAEALRRCFSG